jgi:polyisoprenoid-binding protein YceI
MKLSRFMPAMLSLLIVCSANAVPQAYIIDPMHSYVLWHINHFGFSNPSGKWFANGTLTIDGSNLKNNKANITIHVADFVTGIPELDKHLGGPLFFDVAHFQNATFVSDQVTYTGKNTFNLHGNLTVHGVTKPITLEVTQNKIGMNPISNKASAGYSATVDLKRSDFAINTLLPDLSDAVKLNIEVEAHRP